MSEDGKNIRYSIFDPTGNITALVESFVPAESQVDVATALMEKHAQVEQVGFLDLTGPSLQMAGGEFCGNAAMSAAALYLLRTRPQIPSSQTVLLHVSGAAAPVQVQLAPAGREGQRFLASVQMPPARSVAERTFALGDAQADLPLVLMDGISHLVIPKGHLFYECKHKTKEAEAAAVRWAEELGADALGLLFFDEETMSLCPLVFVPSSKTLFWEHACASGTTAIGIWKGETEKTTQDLTITQPGGQLRISYIPAEGRATLYGATALQGTHTLTYS